MSTKPKGKRKSRDPDAPKKALSAYLLFQMDYRNKVKDENPEFTFGEIGRKLGEMWKSMTDEDKEVYRVKSEEDKKRYENENKVYLENKAESASESDTEREKVTKKRKKRAVKDPNAPKKPLTPFMRYSQKIREFVKEENPGAKFGEIGKIIGARWKALSAEEKAPFEESYKVAMEAYAKAKEAYAAEIEKGAATNE